MNRQQRRDRRYKRGLFAPVQPMHSAVGVPWLLWGLLVRGGYLGLPMGKEEQEEAVPGRVEGFLGRAGRALRSLFS